jgi:hemerythrin-like domain-containing protein
MRNGSTLKFHDNLCVHILENFVKSNIKIPGGTLGMQKPLQHSITILPLLEVERFQKAQNSNIHFLLRSLFERDILNEISKSKEPGNSMRISKNLRSDQENISRFVAALGSGSVILSTTKYARPSFFISAYDFIHDYIEEGFFKKEELIIKALEEGGFPTESGPIDAILTDQKKSREAAELLVAAAKQWQAGDEIARSELGWAVSQFTSAIRQHLERLKSLIFPLIEQTISIDDEHKLSEEIGKIVFEGGLKDGTEKYIKLIATLEDELSDWR